MFMFKIHDRPYGFTAMAVLASSEKKALEVVTREMGEHLVKNETEIKDESSGNANSWVKMEFEE